MCVLSAFLFASFIIVDMFALPSVLSTSIYLRSFVIMVFFFTYVSTFSEKFETYYNWILSGTFVSAIAGIETMIFLATPNDQAYDTYFAGLVLVIIAIFSWTFLNILISLSLSLFAIGVYFYIEMAVRDVVDTDRLPTLLASLFFLGGAVILGIVAQLRRDSYLQQNSNLQNSLELALKEKTIEANDYEYQANHDALTLLPNRRYMTKLLEESLQVAKEKDKILAILFFDLNGFKQLNDVYGHAVGDEVLIIVAKRLELAIRKGDCISRIGGDEYLVGLLIDRDNASDVNTMAAKFAAIISEPMNIDGNMFKVGASVGIAAYPLHGNNVEVLIDIADKKMYRIKQGLQKLAKQRKKKDGSKEAVVIFPGNSKSNSNTL